MTLHTYAQDLQQQYQVLLRTQQQLTQQLHEVAAQLLRVEGGLMAVHHLQQQPPTAHNGHQPLTSEEEELWSHTC